MNGSRASQEDQSRGQVSMQSYTSDRRPKIVDVRMAALQGTHRDERFWMLLEFSILLPSNGFT